MEMQMQIAIASDIAFGWKDNPECLNVQHTIILGYFKTEK